MDGQGKEAQFSTLPALQNERPWGFLDVSLVNIGWGIATWCFLTGGLLASIVGFKTAVIAMLAGDTIGVVLIAIAGTVSTAKYGIDTYTSIISFAGKNGMKIILATFIITNIGWVAVLSSMFARSVQNVYETISGLVLPGFLYPTITIIGILISWLIVAKGPLVMKILNKIIIPALLFVMVVMAFAILKNYDFSEIINAQAIAPYDDKMVNIILAVELCIGAGISWWPSLGGLSRMTKTSRAAFWCNIIGINFACSLAALLGAAAAYVIGGSDPTTWMIPLGGIVLGVVALIFIGIANLTSNTVIMYTTCLGLKQFKFFANKSWGVLTGIFAAPILILGLMPDAVYANYQALINGGSAVFGPLLMMQLIDYFLFRKQHLDLRSIFNSTNSSRYYYWNGVNWGAIVIYLLSIVIYCLILNPITWNYSSALLVFHSVTLPVCLFSGISYIIYGLLVLKPKNVGDVNFYKEYQQKVANN